MNEAARARWWQGRMFVAAMLLALASALVPAMLPSGLTATRQVGSAFDPATNAVALRGRSHMLVRAGQSADEGQARVKAPPPLAGHAAPPAAAPAPAALTANAYPASGTVHAPTARDLWRRTTSARPRAPPHTAA